MFRISMKQNVEYATGAENEAVPVNDAIRNPRLN